ncbi:MAG TPA: plastocyanin/azurin family copper-binding protein [Gemmatimonadales bacterium]
MRVTSMVAGLALALAACAGGEKAADDQAATNTSTPAAGTETPAGTGATHDVDMTLVDGQYRFVPEQLTIKAGDVVRFHNRQGGPHNVMFFSDSIPAGAAAIIDAGMDESAPLTSQMAVTQDEIITVAFNGAPAGRYHYTCVPHQAMGMNGNIIVE